MLKTVFFQSLIFRKNSPDIEISIRKFFNHEGFLIFFPKKLQRKIDFSSNHLFDKNCSSIFFPSESEVL